MKPLRFLYFASRAETKFAVDKINMNIFSINMIKINIFNRRIKHKY